MGPREMAPPLAFDQAVAPATAWNARLRCGEIAPSSHLLISQCSDGAGTSNLDRVKGGRGNGDGDRT